MKNISHLHFLGWKPRITDGPLEKLWWGWGIFFVLRPVTPPPPPTDKSSNGPSLSFRVLVIAVSLNTEYSLTSCDNEKAEVAFLMDIVTEHS